MKDEFKSFYKKDLINMINKAALAAIKTPAEEDVPDCTTGWRLSGIFAMMDEILVRLDDPEVE